MRYVTMVPRPEFELLSSADRQIEMMNAYLLQRPHDETVIDFTGTATTDFAVAILAGLNWLTHCAKLAGGHPNKQTDTIRNFRTIVTLAQRWWLTEGAGDRSNQLLAKWRAATTNVLFDMGRLYAARKADRGGYSLWIINQQCAEINCVACRSHCSF